MKLGFASDSLGSLSFDELLNHAIRMSVSGVTPGFGHGEQWWRPFCYRLETAGCDGWLSIEQEDVLLSSVEGLEKSVEFVQGLMPVAPSDYSPQAI